MCCGKKNFTKWEFPIKEILHNVFIKERQSNIMPRGHSGVKAIRCPPGFVKRKGECILKKECFSCGSKDVTHIVYGKQFPLYFCSHHVTIDYGLEEPFIRFWESRDCEPVEVGKKRMMEN